MTNDHFFVENPAMRFMKTSFFCLILLYILSAIAYAKDPQVALTPQTHPAPKDFKLNEKVSWKRIGPGVMGAGRVLFVEEHLGILFLIEEEKVLKRWDKVKHQWIEDHTGLPSKIKIWQVGDDQGKLMLATNDGFYQREPKATRWKKSQMAGIDTRGPWMWEKSGEKWVGLTVANVYLYHPDQNRWKVLAYGLQHGKAMDSLRASADGVMVRMGEEFYALYWNENFWREAEKGFPKGLWKQASLTQSGYQLKGKHAYASVFPHAVFQKKAPGKAWEKFEKGLAENLKIFGIMKWKDQPALSTSDGLYVLNNDESAWVKDPLDIPPFPTQSLLTIGSDLYLHNELGIFLKNAQGKWEPISDSLGSLYVSEMVAGADDFYVIASESSDELFHLKAGDPYWSLIPKKPETGIVFSFIVFGEDLYLGCEDTGVLRYSLKEKRWDFLNQGIQKESNGWMVRDFEIWNSDLYASTQDAIYRLDPSRQKWVSITQGQNLKGDPSKGYIRFISRVGDSLFAVANGDDLYTLYNGETVWRHIPMKTNIPGFVIMDFQGTITHSYILIRTDFVIEQDLRTGALRQLGALPDPDEMITNIQVVGDRVFAFTTGDLYEWIDKENRWLNLTANLPNHPMTSNIFEIATVGTHFYAITDSGLFELDAQNP